MIEGMMKERSDEEILYRDPVVVRLGGKDYSVKPLTMRAAREWRQAMKAAIERASGTMGTQIDMTNLKPGMLLDILGQVFFEFPDIVIDMFFGYAKDLPREEIEETATDGELYRAFVEVMRLAYPFASGFGEMVQKMAGMMK